MADEDRARLWYERTPALMEEALGKERDTVMHAIIPRAIGGGLDLYYYPNDIPGTAVATQELSDLPGEGSSNAVFDCYELVMFTRHPIDLDAAKDAVIEVFRSEMAFARKNGGAKLLARLKDRGHYPYSDLDREPVA